MSGSQYYKILGLEPTSTDAEVKRRFRALAKQYHPDRNPNQDATEIFQRLLDAYERILKKDFHEARLVQSTHRGKSQQELHREFHRKAWERYEQMRREQEHELNTFYDTFISGPKMTIKRVMGVLAFITLSCLIADEILPKREISDRVISYNQTRYQSIGDHFVNEIHTVSDHSYFLADYQPSRFEQYPRVTIYETSICRLTTEIKHKNSFGTSTIDVHFTFYWIRGLLYTFLLIALVFPFYQKRSTIQVLGSWFVFFVVGATLTLFFISNFRILSIVSLGNWP